MISKDELIRLYDIIDNLKIGDKVKIVWNNRLAGYYPTDSFSKVTGPTLYIEVKPKIRLTEDERAECDYALKRGLPYIAKDSNKKVWAYKDKPFKENGCYWSPINSAFRLKLGKYPMLSWDDKEATLISDLLKEE